MSLPIMTTKEDVISVVNYLKTKVAGATIDEIKAALDAKLVDGRKLAAYVSWSIVKKEGEKYRLTERGRDLSRKSIDAQKEIFKGIIKENKAYNIGVEWIYHQNFEEVTNIEVASHWAEHCKDELGTDNEMTIKKQVVCFFYIAEAANIGSLTIGRRGQATRLSINKEELTELIGKSSFADDVPIDESDDLEVIEDIQDESQDDFTDEDTTHNKPDIEFRVFITHGKNMEIVDQVKTMLELADLDYEIAVADESTAIPVSDKIFDAMRACCAAVICVTADEDMKKEDDTFFINQNVLIEIGAAFVLYEKRVILVWDKRINIPSNLQGLYRCEFEGEELSWSAGMKLMKAVKKLKK